MAGSTTFSSIKFAQGIDEVKKFPAEVSEPGAKTIDKYLEEHTLTFKAYNGPATLKTGELAVQEKSGETFTLPSAATANFVVEVFCWTTATSCKIATAGGATIEGDFISAASTITLTTRQHVTLRSTGTNTWLIVSGEPKRTAVWEASVIRESELEYEPSGAREVEVILQASASPVENVTVGGVVIAGKIATQSTITFRCGAGIKYKAKCAGNYLTCYRTL